MDRSIDSAERLRRYAAVLSAAGELSHDEQALEQWLMFWDESDSEYRNLSNIEHWLAQAGHQRRTR